MPVQRSIGWIALVVFGIDLAWIVLISAVVKALSSIWPDAGYILLFHNIILFYLVLPAGFALGLLAYVGLLSRRVWWLRNLSIASICIFMPMFAYITLVTTLFAACRLDWILCQPY